MSEDAHGDLYDKTMTSQVQKLGAETMLDRVLIDLMSDYIIYLDNGIDPRDGDMWVVKGYCTSTQQLVKFINELPMEYVYEISINPKFGVHIIVQYDVFIRYWQTKGGI